MSESDLSRDSARAVLRQCSVLTLASDAGLDALVGSSQIRSLAKGEVFLREGVVPDHFGVLLSGHVRAVHFTHEGRPITLLVGWPGDMVGLMAMLAGRPVEGDIQAAEQTEIAVVSRCALETLLAEEPRLALCLLNDCTRQLFEVVGVVKSLSVDVVARVATYILRRIPPAEPSTHRRVEVELSVTRVELAAELGTVPETLSRAFATLRDERVIAGRGRTVTVLDITALQQRASGDPAPQRAQVTRT